MPDLDIRFLSIPVIFYLSSVFITCFSAFLILGKTKKQTADYLLAIWFFIIAIHLIFFILFYSGQFSSFPYLLGLDIPLPLIHGPMLYLYILCLTGQQPNRYKWLLHFAPAILTYIYLISFFTLTSQEKIHVYEYGNTAYRFFRKIIMVIIILSGILYVTLSIMTVRQYKRRISDLYSNTEKINLNWSYYLITGIALIWVAVIMKNETLIFTLVGLFILVASYFGISHANILGLSAIQSNNSEEKQVVNENSITVKYQKNFAGEEVIQSIYQKLSFRMEHEKLYKDPELNLNQVAVLLNVHPNILSQTINSVENKNFYDYINQHRIEEFKRIVILPENQKFTILSLAFESGFNSKTSFNRNFKKYMDCSPREFIKNQNMNRE
ncbi:AraC family transcriptional regulator [Elizabethkingia anophelis]|uniref:helix-turn-helix domain-containing protein n=2 Tax=Elizabethkingia anophelis TaxID=1117645 RepID=UPI00063AA867|nr:helix-turn-helix domain-containing protein [Elizabethkingia anophelis]AKH95364.1 AraC family transcriptional regulator [Elizabethkingia anophelis FMS-007]AQW94738.1 AraC family transcriptional regulator [Elizabethkingia anophelis]MCL1691935.1 helix-turn-helix domain-containing protein [Elizabethkingia anophelis]MDV3508526.1 AraC family transcriptional regulator [Elizabethkingia anophelis]MDV3541072.1 AraC family transcriptional regulator [Elizabethkingia anophelis]